MCEWCGPPVRLRDGFSVVERPAQALVGRVWEGSSSQTTDGAIVGLLGEMRDFAGGEGNLWAGPIVGIWWNERPDWFRLFVGIARDDAPREPAAAMMPLEVPAMRFATAWHDADDGEILDHYEAMLGWMEREGLSWDKTRLHHREEYPLHADFSAAPVQRLLVPVK